MSRDYQRSRVYAWERLIPNVQMSGELMTLEEIEVFVRRVWRSERGRYGLAKRQAPEVKDGRGRSRAGGCLAYLTLPKWSRNPWVVLHELAHGLTMYGRSGGRQDGGWHGPRFVGCLIGIAARHLGLDRDALVAAAEESGVDVDVRSIGATPRYGWDRRALDALRRLKGRAENDVELAVAMGVGYRTARGALLTLRRKGLVRVRGRRIEALPR